MKQILSDLKWIILGLIVGFSSMYTAYFMPDEKLKRLKDFLFSFGASLAVSEMISLISKVYRKLKNYSVKE